MDWRAGVFLGGVVALVGQQLSGRSEAKDRNATLMLEQLSILVALSQDYRNRIWEERNNLSDDAVAKWDLGAYRMAQARVRILVSDSELLAAVREPGTHWNTTRPNVATCRTDDLDGWSRPGRITEGCR